MAKKSTKRAAKQAAKVAKKHPALTAFLILLALVLLAGAAYYYYKKREREQGPLLGTLQTGELGVHFLELGNQYVGDCVFIQIGDTEIIVDGGSREDSAEAIEAYVDQYCKDGVVEYAIVTHAHQDHIAAFAGNSAHTSLFRRFEFETIIDFPKTNSTSAVYGRYVAERDAEIAAGAKHYTALECYNNEGDAQRSYELAENVTLNILYHEYYEKKASEENNYSVCFYIQQGDYNYLFMGDLEKEGEESLVKSNDLPRCKLYKGGHHGSSTSSNDVLLSAIQPEYVCICTCAGSTEYTKEPLSTFPTQTAINRLARYTEKIFVTSRADDSARGYTSMNGDIFVKSNGIDFTVTGSNNSTVLKDSEWFKNNRTWPSS
ncbi:MAG: MBL fold metallo-hydrolase [Clostridia bacterium]|nr:MBL fold metallo-hydrolase [Clostridia bacterium]